MEFQKYLSQARALGRSISQNPKQQEQQFLDLLIDFDLNTGSAEQDSLALIKAFKSEVSGSQHY